MGKKNKTSKLIGKVIDDNPEEDELDEELAAVESIRQEKLLEVSNEKSKIDDSKSNYNKSGILQCLENIPTRLLPFKETYQICDSELFISDENDDLTREMAFYDHSLKAVKTGRQLLHQLGIPAIRPSDYFCEHVKTDTHMGRIKDKLIVEEKKMAAFEQRKKRDFDRKFSKKVTKVNKSNEKMSPEGSKDNSRSQRFNEDGNPEKSFKRKAMDKKYGFGGRDKKRSKLADQKSLDDLTEFNPKGGKFVRSATRFNTGGRGGRDGGRGGRGGRGGGRGGRGRGSGRESGRERNKGGRGGKSSSRPGKEARAAHRKSNQS